MIFVLALLLAAPVTYQNDPHGNSSFSAVFDAKLGERINAISSAITCTIARDDAAGTASGECSVPLSSIMVDNTPEKSEHFQAWATNKKSKTADCKFTVALGTFPIKLEANKEVPFSVQAPFTICGRGREDGGKETVARGSALLMPAGGDRSETIRVRAHIDSFNREAYHIGPQWTEGWLARVQKLASIVATTGSIDVSVFVPVKK